MSSGLLTALWVSISVLEIVKTFKKANNIEFKVDFAARRKGDISTNYAKVDKARDVLGWQSSHNLEKMCKDAWEAIQNECKWTKRFSRWCC